jgi:hypothetical protein
MGVGHSHANLSLAADFHFHAPSAANHQVPLVVCSGSVFESREDSCLLKWAVRVGSHLRVRKASLRSLRFNPEGGDSSFFRNVANDVTDYVTEDTGSSSWQP